MTESRPAAPETAVLGLGNVLMGDDALGPTVIASLRARYTIPQGVRVEDLGTPGFDLHPHLVGPQALIIVDTVRADAAPGELRCYRRDEILKHAPTARISPHDPSLKEALLALEFAGTGPSEVMLVGVVPESTEGSVALTAAVAAAVEPAIDAVVGELRRLGHELGLRDPPAEPELWWLDDHRTRR